MESGGSSITLHLRGELDLTGSPLLRSCLHNLVDAGERHVVIDAQELDFIDASGIRAIAREARRLRTQGGRITVVNPPPLTRKLFDLLDISQLVELVDDLDGLARPYSTPRPDELRTRARSIPPAAS